MSDLIINSREQFVDYLTYSQEAKDIISTGWDDINNRVAYGGLPADTLFYLYAKASVGKTYFVTNWILRLLKSTDRRKIVFFSMEMSFHNIIDRFLQGVLLKNLDGVREYVRSDRTNTLDKLDNIGYFDWVSIYDGHYDLNQMDIIIKGEKPAIIFIDHLHRIKTVEKDIFGKTTLISGALFNMKKRHNTRIICLVQLKREGGKDKAMAGVRLPMLEDSKGSGAIEEDADIILALARPDISPNVTADNNRKIDGIFLKNRFPSGRDSGRMSWKYDPATSILSEEYE